MSNSNLSEKEFDIAYRFIKSKEILTLSPVSIPTAFILGGQPGAGKTTIQNLLTNENSNILVINGDDYRKYHPHFELIQAQYGDDSPKYTQPFINAVTEKLIEDLSNEKYNLIVEGTLRTAEVPISTARSLKDKGYRTELCVMAVKPEISYESTILRYENAIAFGETPRATSKEHHDMVVDRIAANLDTIYESGIFDCIKIYTRDNGCIYSSDDSILKPSEVEKEILSGEWSDYEKDNLCSIVQQVRVLKQNRNADDLAEYLAHSNALLNQIGISASTEQLLKRSNLSEEQIIALSSTKIKFTAQKTGEDTYCIVFQKSDLENINSVLSSLSAKNKTEPPKSKR